MRFWRAIVLLAALVAAGPAFAQSSILQGGPWKAGHLPQYSGQGSSQAIISDGGGAGGGASGVNPSEQGLTIRNPQGIYPAANAGNGPYGTNWCDYDAPINNPAGYHYFCLSPNAQGGPLIAAGAGGVAAQLPLSIILNGTTYQFPFLTSGILGPPTTTVGDLALWNNNQGTLLKDLAPGSLPITSTGASTAVTLANHFGRNFSVMDFGAKCDGLTTDDDTSAINAALAYAGTSGGGTVNIPRNTVCDVNGTLVIAYPGVSLGGDSVGGSSEIFFDNGAADDIDIGFQGSQTNNNTISDIQMYHATKTGGVAISVANTAWTTIHKVNIQNAWNGVLMNQINTAEVDSTNINATQSGNSYGFSYSTTIPQRSDSLNMYNVVIEMLNSGGQGMIVDGASNDISAYHLVILGATGPGLHIQNSAENATYYPNYGFFYDFEVDGEYAQALKIDGGAYYSFTASQLDSIHDTNAGDRIIEIRPDTGYSVTRNITITGTQVGTGPGGVAFIDALNVNITGSTFADGGKTTSNTYPALEIGAHSSDDVIVGNTLGYQYGQCCTNNYALQIDNGATQVLIGANNYKLLGGTGSINDLSSGGTINVAGGIDYQGNAMGPTTTYGGTSGTNQTSLANSGTTGTTGSSFAAATGTANAFVNMANTDGATPTGAISTGSGDTGGLSVNAAAGTLNLQSSAGSVDIVSNNATGIVLNATGSSTGNIDLNAGSSATVQFGSAGSFATNGSVATSLGSVGPVGSRTTVQKWLQIKDNGGGTYYLPLF